MSPKRKISIVSPVLNEQGAIPVFYERLARRSPRSMTATTSS